MCAKEKEILRNCALKLVYKVDRNVTHTYANRICTLRSHDQSSRKNLLPRAGCCVFFFFFLTDGLGGQGRPYMRSSLRGQIGPAKWASPLEVEEEEEDKDYMDLRWIHLDVCLSTHEWMNG